MFDSLPFLLAQADQPAEKAAPAAKAAPAEAAAPEAPAAEAPAAGGEAAPAAAGRPRAVVEAAKPEPPAQGGSTMDMIWAYAPIIAVVIFFYLIVLKPQRTAEKSREEMLKQLKKDDRVLTIGGIIGTVANISADGKEVTLKIDSNVKIHVIRSAIQQVLVDTKPGDAKAS